MENYTSRIGNHVYVKNSAEAVKLYKKAFKLEKRGEPWLDDDGFIIHQELLRNGELFLSISDYKHLPNENFVKKHFNDVRPTMLFCAYFHNEDDLRRTYELLSNKENLCTELKLESEDLISEVIDKFGVFWHLRVPKDWNANFVPKD